jgi:putative ABC transport system permease protein
MKVLKLILKNAWRHKLRTILTILGISIAVSAFGFIRTVVTAWNAGVSASATNRMISHHSVSIIFTLPLSYRDQLLKVPGVSAVSYANWFGGAYKDPNDFKNFFPRIALDPETFFSLYPEFILSTEELEAFKKERNACIVGQKIALEHGFKIGDIITMEGDIYPGTWDFVVRGIYKGRDATVDETQMLFQWKYLDERVSQSQPGREGQVGWYVLSVNNPSDLPKVSKAVDDMYMNSRASTKTETEKEWQQSFVSMSSAILTSLTVVSYVIVGIILLVLTNTIIMATRERVREYAVLKTLGFSGGHIIGLIGGESMMIACTGGLLGLLLTFPAAGGFAKAFPTWFPIVVVEPLTITLAVGSALCAGVVAALFPTVRILQMKIVDGLRQIG